MVPPLQRLSFFGKKLYQLIEELGKAGVRGHEKVESKEKEVFKNGGDIFETAPCELDREIDESLSGDDFSSRRSPRQLGLTSDKTKWRQARLFLINLMDYWVERKGTENQEYWRKMDEWELEGKLIQENRSYLRLNRFSWDGAV